jgi:hypothetical protein
MFKRLRCLTVTTVKQLFRRGYLRLFALRAAHELCQRINGLLAVLARKLFNLWRDFVRCAFLPTSASRARPTFRSAHIYPNSFLIFVNPLNSGAQMQNAPAFLQGRFVFLPSATNLANQPDLSVSLPVYLKL